jgi:hypothetical protein
LPVVSADKPAFAPGFVCNVRINGNRVLVVCFYSEHDVQCATVDRRLGLSCPTGILPPEKGYWNLHAAWHVPRVGRPHAIHIDGVNCTVKTHLTVPYVKWGGQSVFTLKVAKDVDVDLTLLGHLSS